MPLSIDLLVKCPFYKKQNEKKTPIFLKSRKIFTLYLGSKYLYSAKIFKSGSRKNLNVRNLQRWILVEIFFEENP